jgi:hypothetical protein
MKEKIISDKKFKNVVERLIEQEGDCEYPLFIECSNCPFNKEEYSLSICDKKITVLFYSKAYIAELDEKQYIENEDI